jgi:hypothetical protein
MTIIYLFNHSTSKLFNEVCNYGFGLLRPSFFIRDLSVLEGFPRIEAAPSSPVIFQFLAFKTRRI